MSEMLDPEWSQEADYAHSLELLAILKRHDEAKLEAEAGGDSET